MALNEAQFGAEELVKQVVQSTPEHHEREKRGEKWYRKFLFRDIKRAKCKFYVDTASFFFVLSGSYLKE